MRVEVGVDARLRSPVFANGDGVRVAPDATPTATATSHRTGAALAALTVTATAVTGEYYATLPAQADVDRLTVVWSCDIDTEAVTFTQVVDVVQDHYADLVELRDALTQKPNLPVRRLEAVRDDFARIVHEARGESWTTEYHVHQIRVPEGGQRIGVIDLPHCVNVTLVSVADPDDAAQTGWEVTPDGFLSAPTVWLAEGTWTVVYTHGVNEPQALNRACVEYVKSTVMRDDAGTGREIAWQGDNGARFLMANPAKGIWTSISSVNEAIDTLPDHRAIHVN